MGHGCCGCDHQKECEEPKDKGESTKCEVCGSDPCVCEPGADEDTKEEKKDEE